jgi:putative ABC transport system permease protein
MLTLFWREILRSVLDSVRTNRVRFFLTLSGVIVGSASMVLLSGLLAGAEEALSGASMQASEKDLIEIEGRPAPEKQRQRTTRPIDQGDVATLDDSPLLGEAQVVGMRTWTDTARWERKTKTVTLVSAGAGQASLELYHLTLAKGRFFNADDVRARRSVAVIGHQVWVDLFGRPDALEGLEVRVAGARFSVIGVLTKKPQMGDGGPWAWDGRVLLPETTYGVALPSTVEQRRSLETIFVRLRKVQRLADRIGAVGDVIKSTLMRRHHGVRNFHLSGQDPDHAGEAIMLIISALIMTTAVISLLVGGINVMNIMLVAITERTREIGVRRAVGAPRALIMLQFLAESTMTAALGGLLGVLIGAGLTLGAAAILNSVTGSWTFHIAPWAPPLALGAAMFVGATFGLYPAWRASRLDPVEALRFE